MSVVVVETTPLTPVQWNPRSVVLRQHELGAVGGGGRNLLLCQQTGVGPVPGRVPGYDLLPSVPDRGLCVN